MNKKINYEILFPCRLIFLNEVDIKIGYERKEEREERKNIIKIIYILNCYKKLNDNKYQRDFYVGEVKKSEKKSAVQKLKYRLRNHYNENVSFKTRKNYDFVDVGYFYFVFEDDDDSKTDIEKIYINMDEVDLHESCELLGLQMEFKIWLDTNDAITQNHNKYLIYEVDISKQFWNEFPNECILGVVINDRKNERRREKELTFKNKKGEK